MAITHISKEVVQSLRKEIDAVLNRGDITSLAAKHNIIFHVGNAKFSENTITFVLDVSTKSVTGEVNTKEAESFKKLATSYGLKPEHLGMKFCDTTGKTFQITGLKPAASKYPIMVKSMIDGKTYRMSELRVVAALIGREK